MKLIRFTTKEQEKYKVIKDLVDYTRNKRRTAIILGVAIRHVNRLIKVYKQQKAPLIIITKDVYQLIPSH